MHPLDNCIWRALTTSQAHLGEKRESACKFHKEVSLLGGMEDATARSYACLISLLATGERVGLFLDETPEPAAGWKVITSVPLLEMACENGRSSRAEQEETIPLVALSDADVPEMMALVEMTKPGPFGLRTREMGDYFGIRDGDKLVAMAGERLRIPGYTEISAVCTHPEYLGRGYAGALIRLLMERIHRRGEHSFLHVRPENERAVRLYEKLGFEKRLLSSYVILQKE